MLHSATRLGVPRPMESPVARALSPREAATRRGEAGVWANASRPGSPPTVEFQSSHSPWRPGSPPAEPSQRWTPERWLPPRVAAIHPPSRPSTAMTARLSANAERHYGPNPINPISASTASRLLSQFRHRQLLTATGAGSSKAEATAGQLELGGQSCQAASAAQWQELHAWCGLLATNLEGALARIDALGVELRTAARGRADLESRVAQLSFRASQKNISGLEQRLQSAEDDVEARTAGMAELTDDLRSGHPVNMLRKPAEAVRNAVDHAAHEVASDAASGRVAARPWPRSPSSSPSSQGAEAPESRDDGGGVEAWVRGMPLTALVTGCLHQHLCATGLEPTSQLERAFLLRLGRDPGGRDTVRAMLRQTCVLDDLADLLWDRIAEETADDE
jgi:hypothetical protein